MFLKYLILRKYITKLFRFFFYFVLNEIFQSVCVEGTRNI